ncbi:P-loop NTPase [Roseiconus nitratireducens]|uniref:P-loop NTPase n=1 Tax=Roseiconus nitratireducens TaxID=2605748 RepID=A0A5M6DAC6_9BACT|nr:P-loop NTPase [Roseiconus nitratireducens]KAA5544514.1 P-loop NTPase [Roseiconus nitratireducens]
MKTDESFIGAFARHRRLSTQDPTRDQSADRNAASSESPSGTAAVSQDDRQHAPASGQPAASHRANTGSRDAVDPTGVDQTWVGEFDGQSLRIDTPAATQALDAWHGPLEEVPRFVTTDPIPSVDPADRNPGSVNHRADPPGSRHTNRGNQTAGPVDRPTPTTAPGATNTTAATSRQAPESTPTSAPLTSHAPTDSSTPVPPVNAAAVAELNSSGASASKSAATASRPPINSTVTGGSSPAAKPVEKTATQQPAKTEAPTPGPATHPDKSGQSHPAGRSPSATESRKKTRWAGAAWEVDAFDIPQRVADLFFDESFFRSIAVQMNQAVRAGLQTMLVTSVSAGEGRSTVAIGTAISAAASGLRVALVDVDAESPHLVDHLGLEIDSDWVTAIRHGETLESVAVLSLEDTLTLLPLTTSLKSKAPVTPNEIDQLCQRVTDCFDLVLFDGPTAASWPASRIAAAMDSCLIVRDIRQTSQQDVASIADQFRAKGVQGLGVVDNFCQ